MSKKSKKTTNLLLFLSVFMFAFGWAMHMVSLSLDGIAEHLSANILQERKPVLRPFSAKSLKQLYKLRMMLSYSPALPEEIIRPNLLCYTPEIENPVYQAELMEKEIRITPNTGEEFSVTVYATNTGNVPWFSDRSGCKNTQSFTRLGTSRHRDQPSELYYEKNNRDTGWAGANRIKLVENRVDPGQIGSFHFISKAPFKVDTYRAYFQLVTDGVMWMEREQEMLRLDMAIKNGDIRDDYRLKYINWTSWASIIDADAKRFIDVDISDQKIAFFVGDVKVREFGVSSGTFKTPTPLGKGKIYNKQELRVAAAWPHYHMPKWQGLAFEKHRYQFLGYGFHGLPYLANDNGVFWNEALNHIGVRVSHGCVRILPFDAEDFFNLTEVGDEFLVHE